ncbi:MAG: ankyrin repeat domain-containing protein [bacterium]
MTRQIKRFAIAALALVLMVSIPGRSSEIHVAAASGDVSRIKYILARDADKVNSRDREGVTPLHYAAAGGKNEAVLALLEKGAEIDAAAFSGATPLYLAAAEGNTETVRLLVRKGAEVVKSDKMGCAPVHAASGNGHLETVKFLVEKGARAEALCHKLNAAELAHALGYRDTVSFLESQGAKLRLHDSEVVREVGKLRQSEAIMNLKSLCTLQHAYHEKYKTYAPEFRLLDFKPAGNTRHAFFLDGDTIQPSIEGPFRLSREQRAFLNVSDRGFTALAAGNVDKDPDPDVWLINHDRNVKPLQNDVEEKAEKQDQETSNK